VDKAIIFDNGIIRFYFDAQSQLCIRIYEFDKQAVLSLSDTQALSDALAVQAANRGTGVLHELMQAHRDEINRMERALAECQLRLDSLARVMTDAPEPYATVGRLQQEINSLRKT
jgi:hypothetical protein